MGDVISFFDLNTADTASTPQRPTVAEAEARFMSLAAEVGLDLRDIHFGVTQDIVRVATTDDKAGKRSGWYVIHEEQGLLFGALGNWKSDHGYVKFTGRDAATIDGDLMRRINEKQEARRREAAELQRRNAAEAAAIVQNLPQAPADHPYLLRKQIGANGAQLLGSDLLLPIYNLAGEIVSTQTIGPDGEKTFRTGCTSKGVYVIGGPTPNYVICEGFATGASIHEATGMRVYVTFNAGNMASLAPEIADREGQFGGARAVIAGDNDTPNREGVCIGQAKAEQAAHAIGGALVLVPPEPGTDWNDVAIRMPQLLRAAFAEVRPLFQAWDYVDEETLPRRQWLYGKHYIRKFCSLTVAPGGLGKSTLALVEAIAMVTGRNLLGFQSPQRLKWVYFNAEDPLEEIHGRVLAVLKAFNIPQSEIKGQLFIASGRDQELNLATGETGEVVEAAFQMIRGFIRYYGVDGITLDPLANMHDSPETNELMRRLGKRLSRLADDLNCAIEIVHHTRKLGGREATVEDARGGSALIGAVRCARVLLPMEEDEAARYGLDSHKDHFCVSADGKNNLARQSDKAEWYVRSGIHLKNGDSVAIVRSWEPPDPFDGISKDDARKVQDAVRALDEPARESPQANNWIGYTVGAALGLNVNTPGDKARVKALIRTWIGTDVLRSEKVRDTTKGRDVPVVVCGDNRM